MIYIPLLFVIAMVAATIGLGIWATRRSRSASDFFVASRSVGVGMNASAISGEYLSAASFMGVAGLVMKFGYDPLWYPACFAAGYLFLLLFIAGPLRRFGAYTIPDFAEGRFNSPVFRKIAVTFVLFIGFFYTMPQMKGAGVTMMQIMGWPYWAGIAVVGSVITFNVAVGGMKGITFVQAFQYWAKMFAIAAPLFVLLSVYGGYSSNLRKASAEPNAVPVLVRDATVTDPKTSKEIQLVKDTPAPQTVANKTWIRPFGAFTNKNGYPLLYTYSLIVALVCGTAGLPHILVRFYTNPDGQAAKRTTFWVMVLIGVFYMFTPIWGVLGRFNIPELYSSQTDTVVIAIPKTLNSQLLGLILAGITSAGAFAAFMSTFSGLLVSMSGALAHDIYGRMLRPNSSQNERLLAFKISAILIGVTAMGLGLLVENQDIAVMVGWAFAIGAASYFPLLLIGSWWRGLTMIGAATGMLTAGLLTLIAVVLTMAMKMDKIRLPVGPLMKTLMEQPAIWGVPLSIILMVVVSKLTQSTIPKDVDVKMLRLHAPEEMGLSKNYIEH
jgi:cation/acetate symporter